jgi:hypothetical protein
MIWVLDMLRNAGQKIVVGLALADEVGGIAIYQNFGGAVPLPTLFIISSNIFSPSCHKIGDSGA